MTTTRKFGIEIEAIGNHNTLTDIARVVQAAGVQCEVEGYNHSTRDHWKVITDGSIRGQRGFELVSPPLQGQQGLDQVRKVCAALDSIGVTVNKSCGLHVHFDASDLQLRQFKNLAKHWVSNEDIFDAMMPVSRRTGNVYCQSNIRLYGRDRVQQVNACFDAIENATSLDQLVVAITGVQRTHPHARYHKFNLCSFWRHGTLEIRHHSGTTDADKICSWVTLMGAWIDRFATVNPRKLQRTQFSPRREWATDFERRFGYRLMYKLNIPQVTAFYRARIIDLGGSAHFPRQAAA